VTPLETLERRTSRWRRVDALAVRVVIVPRCVEDPLAEELLRLATSRAWQTGGLENGTRRGTKCVSRSGSVVAAPREWDGTFRLAKALKYGKLIDLGGTARGREGIELHNGRFATELDAAPLREAMRDSDGQVGAITVARDARGYRERLRVAADGRVLGFRRLYHDGIEPAPLPSDWPHRVRLGAKAIEALGRGRSLPASFQELVSRCRSKGIRIRSYRVGGLVWDLATEEGLLSFFEHALSRPHRGRRRAGGGGGSANARLEGDVVVEAGARIEDGAIVIGPAFVGAGAVIGKGAIVRGVIVGPEARVAPGEIVSNRVILANGRLGGKSGGSAADRCSAATLQRIGERAFREWPLLSYARLGKRALDIAGAAAALIVTAPLFPIVALAIKLNSRGPVFYRDRRQGRRGKEFWCLKFRTMVTDAHAMQDELRALNEVDGPQFKIEHDPRLTAVGAFLRTTNLDEIPQFLNVLAGQMSVVGPRPSPDEENQTCPMWREARLSVRPGITGLWQVERSASRDNDFQEWIYYDTDYVRNLSFRRDLVIALKTAKILLDGFVRLFVGANGGSW